MWRRAAVRTHLYFSTLISACTKFKYTVILEVLVSEFAVLLKLKVLLVNNTNLRKVSLKLQNISALCNISSRECKKVVSDILVETEIFTNDKSTGKMAYFEL